MLKRQRFCSLACRPTGPPLRGEKATNWHGDDAGYLARHSRVWRVHGPASDYGCYNRQLGLRDCTSTTYEWSKLHGADGLDPLDYYSLCKQCHNRYDGLGPGVFRPSTWGSKHFRAKLSDDDVREIRSRPVVRGSIKAWSKEFDMCTRAMGKVVSGETYRGVA
jgi:hypothetical protein